MDSKGYSRKNNLLLGAIGILTIILVGFVSYLYLTQQGIFRDRSVLAVVGDKKITQKDLNEMIYGIDFKGTPENPTRKISREEKEELVNQLVEDAIIEVNAKELNVSVSDDEINKNIQDEAINYDSLNEVQKNVTKKSVRSEILKKKTKEAVLGVREGRYVFFRFDKYFKENEGTLGAKVTDEMVQKQKEYAQNLSQAVSKKLKAGEINFDQAVEIIAADPQISAKAFSPVHPDIYGTFDKTEAEQGINLFAYKEFLDKVSPMKKNDTSEPFVMSRKVEDGSTKEFAFAVIQVNEAKNGTPKTYENWFNEQKQRLSVKIYSDKIAFPFKINIPIANADGACVTYADGNTHNSNLKIQLYYRALSGRNYSYYSYAGSNVTMLFYGTTGINPNAVRDDGIQRCAAPLGHRMYAEKSSGWRTGLMTFNPGGSHDDDYNINCDDVSGFQVMFPRYGKKGNTRGDTAVGAQWKYLSGDSFYAGFSTNVTDMSGYGAIGTTVDEIYNSRLVLNLDKGTWANGKVLYYRVAWLPSYQANDQLSTTLGADKDNLSFTPDEKAAGTTKSVNFTATPTHSSVPAHNVVKYEWDFNYNDNAGFNPDPTAPNSKTATHSYAYSATPVTVAVRVTCAGGLVRIARTVITFDVGGHEIVCRDLTAEPQQGTVPLTINFAADIIDSLGHAITQYEWDFDWDGAGSNFTSDRTTAVNRTTFTFDKEAKNRRIGVRGTTGEAGLGTVSCPVSVNIDAVNWSESNEIEIAP